MLGTLKILGAVLLLFIHVGCASPPPARTSGGTREIQAASADSLSESHLDELFADIHEEAISTLRRKSAAGDDNLTLIEAESIIKLAEEEYLRGNMLLAIELLYEAKQLLRHAR